MSRRGTSSTARSFFDPADFAQLRPLTAARDELRSEAVAASTDMTAVSDRRSEPDAWMVLPLRVEADDRVVFSDEHCARNRRRAPRTVELVEAIEHVEAYSFSALAAGADIAAHRHHRPFVTASLCLSGGDGAVMKVGRESRQFVDGEWLVFDYTQPHAVVNHGSSTRLVLLVLLPAPND